MFIDVMCGVQSTISKQTPLLGRERSKVEISGCMAECHLIFCKQTPYKADTSLSWEVTAGTDYCNRGRSI